MVLYFSYQKKGIAGYTLFLFVFNGRLIIKNIRFCKKIIKIKIFQDQFHSGVPAVGAGVESSFFGHNIGIN